MTACRDRRRAQPISDKHRAVVAREDCEIHGNLTVLLRPAAVFPAFPPAPS
jgi:hypothetical protein